MVSLEIYPLNSFAQALTPRAKMNYQDRHFPFSLRFLHLVLIYAKRIRYARYTKIEVDISVYDFVVTRATCNIR